MGWRIENEVEIDGQRLAVIYLSSFSPTPPHPSSPHNSPFSYTFLVISAPQLGPTPLAGVYLKFKYRIGTNYYFWFSSRKFFFSLYLHQVYWDAFHHFRYCVPWFFKCFTLRDNSFSSFSLPFCFFAGIHYNLTFDFESDFLRQVYDSITICLSHWTLLSFSVFIICLKKCFQVMGFYTLRSFDSEKKKTMNFCINISTNQLFLLFFLIYN